MPSLATAEPEFEWGRAAELLAGLVPVPALVLDAFFVVRMANQAMEDLAGWPPQRVIGRSFAEIFCLPEEGRASGHCFHAALDGHLRSCRTTVIRPDGRQIQLDWQLARTGADRQAAVATARLAAGAPARRPPLMTGEERLEIRTDEGHFGEIVTVWSGLRVSPGDICHRAIAGLPEPCPNCPALHLFDPAPRTTVVSPPGLQGDRLRMVTAQPTGHETAEICARELDLSVRESLAHARLASLGRRGRLSTREQQVLAHLATGETPEDIASALHITRRTVKFHQANVLAKVGAKSRLDLMRLLV